MRRVAGRSIVLLDPAHDHAVAVVYLRLRDRHGIDPAAAGVELGEEIHERDERQDADREQHERRNSDESPHAAAATETSPTVAA